MYKRTAGQADIPDCRAEYPGHYLEFLSFCQLCDKMFNLLFGNISWNSDLTGWGISQSVWKQ